MPEIGQLRILNRGVEVWNAWRANNPDVVIDLTGADFRGRDFRNINLQRAYLTRATFGNTDLTGANCEFSELTTATFIVSKLTGCRFTRAKVGDTSFLGTDLSDAIGLTEIIHLGPSRFDLSTLRAAKGRLAESFLIAAGLSRTEALFARLYDPELSQDDITTVAYDIDRHRGTDPIQLRSVFISYSHVDSLFVDRLTTELARHDIRYWRDTYKLVAGKLEKQIDRAIRFNPTVVLVLSEHAIQSDWVEWEVTRARVAEKDLKRDVLCPISIDNHWLTSEWSGPTKLQIAKYNVLDFGNWRNEDQFRRQFGRLIQGLHLFYASSANS